MAAHYYLTWDEVYDRLTMLGLDRFERIYGIPRGGSIVAGLTRRAVTDPTEADCIVDDIVDSGRTRERFKDAYPHLPFLALVDKQGPDRSLPWVVFPWEGTAAEDGAGLVV